MPLSSKYSVKSSLVSGVNSLLSISYYVCRILRLFTVTMHSRFCWLLQVHAAFDKVPLLYKMQSFGFSPHLVYLLYQYLSKREFCITLANAISAIQVNRAGVPQGGRLSAAMYAIYTSDYPYDMNIVNPARENEEEAALTVQFFNANKTQLLHINLTQRGVNKNPFRRLLLRLL